MALTLTNTIAATDRTIAITGTVPTDVQVGYAFRLDDELVTIMAFEFHDVAHVTYRQWEPNRNSWMVRRGQGGSDAASHSAGAEIFGAVDAATSSATTTPPIVFPTGGGGGGSGIDTANTIYLESNNPVPDGTAAVWDTIYNQEAVDITGSGIPAAMGLSLQNGDTEVRIGEAGLWWFELMSNPATDDTAQVDMALHTSWDYSGGPRVRALSVADDSPELCMGAMVSQPADDVPGQVSVVATTFGATPTAPSYDPWEYGVLKIVRLA